MTKLRKRESGGSGSLRLSTIFSDFSENRFPLFRIMHYVTQRPGSSRLAISVNTLTTGSHATAIFRSAGFRSPDLVTSGTEGVLRASRATGMRTTTEVSERPYNRTETVRVCIAPSGRRAARSALAARLTSASDGPAELGAAPERSRPAANGAAEFSRPVIT